MPEDYIKIINEYNGNPDWNIAGLFIYDEILLDLLQTMKKEGIQIPFQYIYGTPYNTKLGGGRNPRLAENQNQILEEQLIQAYSDLGIGCRLALSNHLLQEQDYKDNSRINDILTFLNSLQTTNGVILCDDNFNDYIKKNYPNLQRICSVIRPAIDVGWGNDTPDYYNTLCERYDIVVVNCGFAKNLDNINQLYFKDKIEVLVNTRCVLNCKLAKTHYDLVAKGYKYDPNDDDSFKLLNDKEYEIFNQCLLNKQKNYFSGANFSREEIQILLDNGIYHFKLEGRNWPPETILRDICYYITDEIIFLRLLNNILGVTI